MKPNQCDEPPLYRYTWPGREEAYACWKHARAIKGIADALGFNLQFVPLTPEEAMLGNCSQEEQAGNQSRRVDAA